VQPSNRCVFNRWLNFEYADLVQIHEESGGAVVSTKGVWYPDRSKATEKDPPLYLHVTAPTAEILKKALDKIDELMHVDLTLVEDRKREKVYTNLISFHSDRWGVLTFPLFSVLSMTFLAQMARGETPCWTGVY